MNVTGFMTKVEFLLATISREFKAPPPSDLMGTMATFWASNTATMIQTAYFHVALQSRIFSLYGKMVKPK